MIQTALRTVMGRPRVLVMLALFDISLAILALQPLSAALRPALDLHVAASHMARDDGLVVELVQDHPELVTIARISGILALLIHAVAWWIFSGGILSIFSTQTGQSFVANCRAHASRMLQVGLLGLFLRLLLIPLPVTIALLLRQMAFPRNAAWIWTIILLAGSWPLSHVFVCYLRTLALIEPKRALLRDLRRSLQLTKSSWSSTFMLWLYYGVALLFFCAAQVAIAWQLPSAANWALVPWIALSIACVFGRVLVETVVLVAASQVAIGERHARSHPSERPRLPCVE